jgi:hypothetical protein
MDHRGAGGRLVGQRAVDDQRGDASLCQSDGKGHADGACAHDQHIGGCRLHSCLLMRGVRPGLRVRRRPVDSKVNNR